MVGEGVAHLTGSVVAVAERLPGWATLVRAPNPGPMTLTGTNTWVLRAAGTAEAVVVDPGPAHEQHLRAVVAHAPVAAVLVTHAHPDHVEGLPRFRELSTAPVLPATGTRVVAGLEITAIPTPGHTADSVCYLVAAGGERAVLTGDTILGQGTTVVAWPDGDFGAYLASLQRLAALDPVPAAPVPAAPVPALPGHGPALSDCAAAATRYLAHRRARLDQVRAARAAGATTPAEVVAAVYADVDRSLWPAAEWTVRAQLGYLDDGQRESPAGSPPLDEP